jgi:hypothetical protein
MPPGAPCKTRLAGCHMYPHDPGIRISGFGRATQETVSGVLPPSYQPGSGRTSKLSVEITDYRRDVVKRGTEKVRDCAVRIMEFPRERN